MDLSPAEPEQDLIENAKIPIGEMIQSADYAILTPGEVHLVIDGDGNTVDAATLIDNRGLCCDGNTGFPADLVQKKIEDSEWTLTTDWERCRAHMS